MVAAQSLPVLSRPSEYTGLSIPVLGTARKMPDEASALGGGRAASPSAYTVTRPLRHRFSPAAVAIQTLLSGVAWTDHTV